MYSSVAHMASHPWKAGAAGAVGAVGPGRGLGVLGRCRSSMLLILGKEDRNQGAPIKYNQGKCQTSYKTNLRLCQLELLEG